jgi:hypothetical protein
MINGIDQTKGWDEYRNGSDTWQTEWIKTADFLEDIDREMQRDTDLDEMYIMWAELRRLNMRDSNGQPVPMDSWEKESDNGN